MSIAIGLQALGAGFQGGNPQPIIDNYRNRVEREKRKAQVDGLLGKMNIAGPEAALLETMPVEAQQQYLMQHFERQRQQQAAQARAAAAAANKRAQVEAFAQYAPQPQTEQVARLGPTVEASNAGARSGADLAAVQTRTTPGAITREQAVAAMFDPRLSDTGRKRIMDVYEFQNAQPELSEAEQEIARLESIGIDRPTAIQIKEGVVRVETDPTTREAFLVNLADGTSRPLSAPQAQVVEATPAEAPPPSFDFGERFEGGDGAFGTGAFLTNLGNIASETVGLGQIDPETGSAISDYKVLGEGLLNNISGAYNRQPPSWLLKSIRENIPDPAKPLQGPEDATNKLNALGRDFMQEKQRLEEALRGRQSPTQRAQRETQLSAVDSALAQIQSAIEGIRGTPEMSDEDRALVEKYLQ